jgi:hypothetical protein
MKLSRKQKWIAGIATLVLTPLLMASSCNSTPEAEKAFDDRMNKAASNVLCGDPKESLECKNLREKEKRNSDPNRIGYVYLYNFDGSIKGYFVVKGKVSSTQSQMGGMDMVVDVCKNSEYCPTVMEAAGDDGTYGPNEQGIFFFLANGTMVTYSGEYILTDKPLELQVKQLG